MFNLFKKKFTFEKLFPVIDIVEEDGLCYLDFIDDRKIYFFKHTGSFDGFIYSELELFEKSSALNSLYENIPDMTDIAITYRIDRVDKKFENFMLKCSDQPEYVREFRKHKYEQFKNIRSVRTYLAIPQFNTKELDRRILKYLEKLSLVSMTREEVFSMLWDIINPDKRTNDYNKIPEQIKMMFGDPAISLPELLYNSYIETEADYLAIGDCYIKTYVINIPSNFPDINSLLADVIDNDLDCFITVFVNKNSNLRNSLIRKQKMTRSAVASLERSNSLIDSNIEKFLDYCDKKHLTTCQATINISFLADSYKKIENFKPIFEHWSDLHYFYERYRPVENYLEHIPGLKSSITHSFVVSSQHANLLINGSYYETEPSDSLFYSLNRMKQYYRFYKSERFVNSSLISAATGSGKSVFLNYIWFQFFLEFRDKFQSFILDYGGSYRNLTRYLNQYLSDDNKIVYKELKPDSSEIMNILDIEFGKDPFESIGSKIELLKFFFSAAFRGDMSEDEILLLDLTLQETYNRFFSDPKYKKYRRLEDGSYEYYIDRYIESGYRDVDAFLSAMPIISDLPVIASSSEKIRSSFSDAVLKLFVSKMSNFIKSNSSKMFIGKSTELSTGNHLIIDIKPLVAADPSGHLATLQSLYYLQNRYMMFSDRRNSEYRKLFIIDEYPRMLAITKKVETFVDMLLKTGRKEKIDSFVIAQNANSFHPDFFENIACYYTFRPKSNKELDYLKENLSLDDEFLKIAENIESRKGEYSEILALEFSTDGVEKKVLHFELNDFERKIFTYEGK